MGHNGDKATRREKDAKASGSEAGFAVLMTGVFYTRAGTRLCVLH
jgi:hypothetical protein